MHVAEGKFRRLAELKLGHGEIFDEFFRKAFQLSPDKRFQSVAELVLAFEHATRFCPCPNVPLLTDAPESAINQGITEEISPKTYPYGSPSSSDSAASIERSRSERTVASPRIALTTPSTRPPSTAD
jgi:serine/threonine protein kinase